MVFSMGLGPGSADKLGKHGLYMRAVSLARSKQASAAVLLSDVERSPRWPSRSSYVNFRTDSML